MVHFISTTETKTGRSMASIIVVDFLAFLVSFDLLDEGMDVSLKKGR